LKLTNNFKDLPKVLDVGTHLPVKQEEQQGNERNNYKIFQDAVCPESAGCRLGLIVACVYLQRARKANRRDVCAEKDRCPATGG
jgi:hypothetical protein